MSLRDRPAGLPTTPHIPAQRSAPPVFAPGWRRASFGWLTRPRDAAAHGLAILRLATGAAFAWAGIEAATAVAAATDSASNGRLDSIVWGLVAAVVVGSAATLGIAVAVGVALRVSAAVGTLLVFALSAYAWTTGGDSPFGGFPLVYALVLVVLATTHAGEIWGAGRAWTALPFVRGRRWLS
jgi:thiosulfate dehydrogenase (quinone) large subunit